MARPILPPAAVAGTGRNEPIRHEHRFAHQDAWARLLGTDVSEISVETGVAKPRTLRAWRSPDSGRRPPTRTVSKLVLYALDVLGRPWDDAVAPVTALLEDLGCEPPTRRAAGGPPATRCTVTGGCGDVMEQVGELVHEAIQAIEDDSVTDFEMRRFLAAYQTLQERLARLRRLIEAANARTEGRAAR